MWGAATSAYQVEGGNCFCDWWEWEESSGKERSNQACRHYELFKEDFAIASGLGHNAHRFSIEWSRIEPQPGKFVQEELKHYFEVARVLGGLNIEPVVTLHHFTIPLWLAKKGGWENPRVVFYYLRFVEKILEILAPQVKYWITINEPMVYAYHGYIAAAWPPQKSSLFRAAQVKKNLLKAHLGAYSLIQDYYRKRNIPAPSIGIAQSMQAFVCCEDNFRNRLAARLRHYLFNLEFIDKAIGKNALDFIGVNYYTRSLVDVKSWGIKGLLLDICEKHKNFPLNSMGWEIYPQGLFDLLCLLKVYNIPIIISENGICTQDDNLRWSYIYEHLKQIKLAIDKEIQVKGYLYWSLLDNFEWDKGFAPRFGLVEVDYTTFKRKARDSAFKFAEICRANSL